MELEVVRMENVLTQKMSQNVLVTMEMQTLETSQDLELTLDLLIEKKGSGPAPQGKYREIKMLS